MAALSIACSLSGATRRRSVGIHDDPFAGVRSLVWIGAHPDDEVLIAPLLAALCKDQGVRCSFIVMTRGEKGDCLLMAGCAPDIGAVRSGEMAQAAAYFHANLAQLGYADGGALPDGSAPAWDAQAAGHEQLVASIASLIEGFQPDAVITFDPRHGSSCHPDHRAAAIVAKEAAVLAGRADAVIELETLLLANAPPQIVFAPSTTGGSGSSVFNANVPLQSTHMPAWDALIADMQIHRSQFDESWIEAARAVPEQERDVYFARAADAARLMVSTCP